MSRTPITLETGRLLLRELVEADAPMLVALNSDRRVTRFTGDGPLEGDAHALEILQQLVFPQYERHSVGRLAVVRKSDQQILGWCGLKWHPELDEYDIGYRLFFEHWGKGYATEAARVCLADGRARSAGAQIAAWINPANVRSRAVAEKLGLRYSHDRAEPDGLVFTVYV